MCASLFFRWKEAVFYLATMAMALGQVETSSPAIQSTSPPISATQSVSQSQVTLQAFVEEQRTLNRQEQALTAQGATAEQLQAWRQQNASQLALQQKRAQALGMASALQLLPANRQPRIPANASPALQQFLTTQTTLANARASIHNQLVQQATASGSSLTVTQLARVEQQEGQLFQQQDATLLDLQAQRANTLADAEAQTIRPVPGAVVIPPNTTPQMAAFLNTRNQIRRAMIQLRNQYANAAPTVREAALEGWLKQNADLISQLHQQAQSLSPASTTTLN